MSVRVFRRLGFCFLLPPAASKTPLFTIPGASQPRKHRYLPYLVPPSLEDTAPALLGAAWALEVAATSLLGAACALEVAAPGLLGAACALEIAATSLLSTACALNIAASRLLGSICALESAATDVGLCPRNHCSRFARRCLCIRNYCMFQVTQISDSLHSVPHCTVHGHARVHTSIYIYIYI